MLIRHGFKANNEGLTVLIRGVDLDDVLDALVNIRSMPPPNPEQLAETVENKVKEKWDSLLPEQLLNKTFASRELDIEGLMRFALNTIHL
jgi:hypothetical protein